MGSFGLFDLVLVLFVRGLCSEDVVWGWVNSCSLSVFAHLIESCFGFFVEPFARSGGFRFSGAHFEGGFRDGVHEDVDCCCESFCVLDCILVDISWEIVGSPLRVYDLDKGILP